MGLVKSRQPCPSCKSSTGLAIYADGGTYCHKCFTSTKGGKESFKDINGIKDDSHLKELDFDGEFGEHKQRALSKDTLQRFGVKVQFKPSGGSISKVIYPHIEDGVLQAQKFRNPSFPKGSWVGRTRSDGTKYVPGFFGQHLWDSGKTLTITEGEYDAMSVYQMTGNYPVVSIPDGVASLKPAVEKAQEWLLGFECIKICFDSDTSGVEGAKELAKILPNDRIEIVNLQHYKDANEYLQQKKQDEFKKEWWAAKVYQPAGLVGGSERFDDLFKNSNTTFAPYPFHGLNKETLGLKTSELVTVISGSGMGKSSVVAELTNHLREKTDFNVGLMFLEESVKKTKLRMMSLASNQNLEVIEYIRELKKFERDNPDISDEDNWLRKALEDKFPKMMQDPETMKLVDDVEYLKELHDQTIGAKDSEGRDRFVMFDHFGSNDIETISSLIRAMAKVHNCKYVILDHISILVSDQENGDERKALDEIATKLRTLVQNLDIGLIMVAHLKRPNGKPHEEGGKTSLADIRGTAGIGQLSDLVIGLERNGQADCPVERNLTTLRIVKNRKFGSTGVASVLYYDPDTNRMREVDEEDIGMLVAESQGDLGDLSDFNTPDDDTPAFDKTANGQEIKSLRPDKTVIQINEFEEKEDWVI